MIAILQGILPGLRATRVTLISGSLWLIACYVAIIGSRVADLNDSTCTENLTCRLLKTAPTTIEILPSVTLGLALGLLIWSLGTLGEATSDLLYGSLYQSQPLVTIRAASKTYQNAWKRRGELAQGSETNSHQLKFRKLALIPGVNQIPPVKRTFIELTRHTKVSRRVTLGPNQTVSSGNNPISPLDQLLAETVWTVYETSAGQSTRETEEALEAGNPDDADHQKHLNELQVVYNSPSELGKETRSLEIIKFSQLSEPTYEKLAHDLSEINLKLAASIPFAAIAIEFAAFHHWSSGTTIFCFLILVLAARIWLLAARDKFEIRYRVCSAIDQANLETSSLRRVRRIGESHARVFGNSMPNSDESDKGTVINIANDRAAISSNPDQS